MRRMHMLSTSLEQIFDFWGKINKLSLFPTLLHISNISDEDAGILHNYSICFWKFIGTPSDKLREIKQQNATWGHSKRNVN